MRRLIALNDSHTYSSIDKTHNNQITSNMLLSLLEYGQKTQFKNKSWEIRN